MKHDGDVPISQALCWYLSHCARREPLAFPVAIERCHGGFRDRCPVQGSQAQQ
jgi:hypothetical protein